MVRLVSLCDPASLAEACRAIGAMPTGDLSGWGAIWDAEAKALEGVRCLQGSTGALLLGGLGELQRWGRHHGGEGGRALAAQASAVEVGLRSPGLGPEKSRRWEIPGASLSQGRTLVMGVVNVTPDSFSDGGRHFSPQAAIDHGLALLDEGADLLDIGGESTNPFGAQPVDAAEERRRVQPVIEALAKRAGAVPISIDTTKAEVARAALEAGARVVNDVSGLRQDPALAEVVARANAGLCLMHMRGRPQTMQGLATYRDLLGEVLAELQDSLSLARQAEIPEERICLDPGIGFAKTAAQNLTLLQRQAELLQLGRPLLLGVSRKSFIGKVTGRPPGERLFGSLSAIALAASAGACVVRVHDVKAAREAVAIADAIRNPTSVA